MKYDPDLGKAKKNELIWKCDKKVEMIDKQEKKIDSDCTYFLKRNETKEKKCISQWIFGSKLSTIF